MQYKICSNCKENKPFSEFYKDRKKASGIRAKCKVCCAYDTMNWRVKNRSRYNNYAAAWRAKNPERQHATDIKRHYGLSIDQYNEMLIAQSNKCKICSKLHDVNTKRGRLYVDHDHDTGKIRGLLCGACNSGIGYLNHDIDLLYMAINYLANT
jgi:nitrate/TMAO reductase-like tetraheme cytochrome c subunit